MIDTMNYGHGWGMGWGLGGGMWILSILFWIFVIAGMFFIARGFVTQKNKPESPPADDSPLTILQKRYARGEIDDETFKHMKQELEEKGS
ncbi:SHOCT domain-containing protein [Kaarinaea lacus]